MRAWSLDTVPLPAEGEEKRGILDIVRDELATRAVFVLGDKAFSDILITEFRIQ